MCCFCTKRKRVPYGTVSRRHAIPDMNVRSRPSAGLMGACCLRSVPRHCMGYGLKTQLCSCSEAEEEKRYTDDEHEGGEELEEVLEIVAWRFVLSVSGHIGIVSRQKPPFGRPLPYLRNFPNDYGCVLVYARVRGPKYPTAGAIPTDGRRHAIPGLAAWSRPSAGLMVAYCLRFVPGHYILPFLLPQLKRQDG